MITSVCQLCGNDVPLGGRCNCDKATRQAIRHSNIKDPIDRLCRLCHEASKAAGWPKTEKGTRLMLIVSEVAEAMEGERKRLMDDHLPHRPMAEVELADAVIRIFDYCGQEGYDLGGALAEKLEYNRSREDHKAEARAQAGGKAW